MTQRLVDRAVNTEMYKLSRVLTKLAAALDRGEIDEEDYDRRVDKAQAWTNGRITAITRGLVRP